MSFACSAVAQIEDRIAQADRQVRAASTKLARWIGDAATQPLDRFFHDGQAQCGIDATRHRDRASSANLRAQTAGGCCQADVMIAQTNREPTGAPTDVQSTGPAFPNMISINLSVPAAMGSENRQDRELAAKSAGRAGPRANRRDDARTRRRHSRMVIERQSNRERLTRYMTAR